MDHENPIEAACQSCGFKLLVKRKGAGKTVKCPGCSSPVLVPFPDPKPPAPAIPVAPTAAPKRVDPPAGESLSWLDEIEAQPPNVTSFPAGLGGVGGLGQRDLPNPPTATSPVAMAESQVSRSNAYAPVIKTSGNDSTTKLPSVRNYPVLVIYAMISRIIGYIILALAAVFVLVSFIVVVAVSMRSGDNTGAALIAWVSGSLTIGLSAMFAAGVLIMNAEIIELAMHVQSNTLATAHAVRSANR